MLSREEERRLARAARAGDQRAFDRLIRAHMPLAYAMAWQFRSFGLPIEELTSEAMMGLVKGARDFDPLEQQRLDSSDVQYLPPGRIDSDDAVARAADGLNPAPTGLYLHVDLDVLDSEEAKVNIYSAPDGLSAAQLESQVTALLYTCPVRAISLTAYDPEVDAEDRVPPIAMRLLEIVAERVAREP